MDDRTEEGGRMKQITKPTHGSLEWLQVRHRDENGKVRFGASEAPILMGCSPYKTLADLALEKWAEPQVRESSEAMMRGTMLEPALLEFAGMMLDIPWVTPEEMFVNGRMIATLDAIGLDESLIVEAKTTTAYSSDDELPEDYYWQAVAQLACTNADEVRFVVLDRRMRLTTPLHWVVRREFSTDAIEALMEKAEEVGASLDAGELPPGAVLTEDIVKALYPSPEGVVELGSAGVEAVMMFTAAKAAREEAEANEKAARDALTAMLGGFEVGTVDGQQVVSFKSRSTGARVDMKQLEQDHPDLVAKYRKDAGTTRVLRIH